MSALARLRILARLTKSELMAVIVHGCPECQTGTTRETTGVVCQWCGIDYAPAKHEIGSHDA